MIVKVAPPVPKGRMCLKFKFIGCRNQRYEAETDGELNNIDEMFCVFGFLRTNRYALRIPMWK